MDRRLRFRPRIGSLLVLLAAAQTVFAGTPATPATPGAPGSPHAAPLLKVAGDDFPELLLPRASVAVGTTEMAAPTCEQLRARRIDELDPLWKRAVERIHFDCEDLDAADVGFDMTATMATAFLRPGSVEFAGVPVAEVRLMDSELWGDHQYILQANYTQVREALKQFIATRCQARMETSGALVEATCVPVEDGEGLYLQTGELGGIWIHPAREDASRTVYAEAWAD